MDAPKAAEIAEIAKKAVHLERWLQPLLVEYDNDLNSIFNGFKHHEVPEKYCGMRPGGVRYSLELDNSEEDYLCFGGYWRGEHEHSLLMPMEYLSDYQAWLEKAVAKRDELLAAKEVKDAEEAAAKAEKEERRIAKIKSDYQDLVERGLA